MTPCSRAAVQNSKLEMDILDALDDTKAINKRKLNVDTSSIIGKMRDSQEARAKESIELDDAEEDLIEQTEFAGSSRRIGEEEEEVSGQAMSAALSRDTEPAVHSRPVDHCSCASCGSVGKSNERR